MPAWILPPPSCALLHDIAMILPPGSSAFEFGSGCSTHALRRAFTSVTSIESSSEWLEKTERATDGISRRAADISTVIPMERCWNRLRLIESFSLCRHKDVLQRLHQAALILVDSPPNPAKREHALFIALQYAAPGAVIILDDLDVRAVSRFAHRLAKQNEALFRFWRLNIDHQLGIFLKLKPGRVHSRPTLIEFVGSWLRA
ncbi:MAG TPA: hypothetical protein VJ721_05285 [Chthoniobacterales bacterium]|nr:hypothetical protein [Chthoniobacterales bacterium]